MSPEEINEMLGLSDEEIIIDLFAGGGGASTGIEWATGRSPDEAVNHSAAAIAIHQLNHPNTRHHHSDIWEADPIVVAAGRRVGLLWLSPDCTHFSRAKGARPVSKKIRVLAHVAVRYAKAVRPRAIMLENVPEFLSWGPISRSTGKPDPRRKGHSFRGSFVSSDARAT
jgi:DNA (cytosine-5)-methyltransferase 1